MIKSLYLLFILYPSAVFGFTATVQSMPVAASRASEALWEISGNSTDRSIQVIDGDFIIQLQKNDSGYVLHSPSGNRTVISEVFYDENAGIPWNLLVPQKEDVTKALVVESLANGIRKRKTYIYEQTVINNEEMQILGISANTEKKYVRVRLLINGDVICEQVWARDELLWVYEINRHAQNFRLTYAE